MQPAAAGAERDADGELAPPLRRSRHLQVDHVRDCHQQHEEGDSLDPQRDARRLCELAPLGTAWKQAGKNDEGGRVGGRRPGDQATVGCGRLLGRGGWSDPRRQAHQHRHASEHQARRPHRGHLVGPGVKRRPHVDLIGGVAGESRRRDADHGVLLRPDAQRPPEDGGITAVRAPPVAIAQHRHRLTRRRAIVRLGEYPSETGGHAKKREVVVIGEDDRYLPGIPAAADAGGGRSVGRHPGEGRDAGAQVGVRAIRCLEPEEAPAAHVAAVDVQPRDPRRLLHVRRRREQEPVDQAEGREVRREADAERERRHHEEGALPRGGAKNLTQVEQEAGHHGASFLSGETVRRLRGRTSRIGNEQAHHVGPVAAAGIGRAARGQAPLEELAQVGLELVTTAAPDSPQQQACEPGRMHQVRLRNVFGTAFQSASRARRVSPASAGLRRSR